MSTLQIIMLLASAFFAFKIYEHIQTLQDPNEENNNNAADEGQKTVDAFSPFSASDLVEKADNAYQDGDYTKALAFLNEANAKDENNEEILFKIAYILHKAGDKQEALTYYKDALTLDKKNEVIHNALASLYRENKEYASAKIHLKASLDIDPDNSVTYYNYGNLLVDMEHFDEAKEMYEKALELNPDFGEAKAELEKLTKE